MKAPRRSWLATITVGSLCATGILLLARSATAQEKIPIRTADELPRHSYQIPGKVSDLLEADADFTALARQVRADVEADLAKYEIEDATTLQKLHGVLLSLDLLDGDHDGALGHLARVRELEKKEAKKLTMGLVTETLITARRKAGNDPTRYRELFGKLLLEKVRKLPWGVVGDEIEQGKGRMEIISESLMKGIVQSSMDPVVLKTGGTISADLARAVVGMRVAIEFQIPLKQEIIAAYQAVIDEHRVDKKDIWAARSVTLDRGQGCTPVVVAIWDSGLDVKPFEGQLWANRGERPDGRDDDGNGFVDDVHGIAFDMEARRSPDLLHALDGMNAAVGEVAKHMKGFMDIQAAIDSPEASAVKRALAGLQGEKVKEFIEDLGLYGLYAHGTHVAGIAAEGNPFARLLCARLTFDYHMIPMCPTTEWVRREAASFQATVDYFKRHNVRVVNMSWGHDQDEIESPLEKHGVGATVEERADIARAMYKIQREGLYEAIKSAPDILFICAAGNADNDVEFEETIPSGFDLPNLLVVGAVDQAGDPTNFTSFGKTVQVYANGFEVESYVPGGKRMKLSGTSMSSPNVTNLAAKMLALKPALKPSQVIELIKLGADRKAAERPMLLIHPRRTLELVKK